MSDTDEVYGNGSDLGYDSFSSGCEMEDDNLVTRDFDYTECHRGIKRPLEGVNNCASFKKQSLYVS